MMDNLSFTGHHPAAKIGHTLSLYGRVLKSWIFFVVLLLGVAATVALASVSRPVFRSEAVLLYQDRGGSNPVALQRDAPTARRVGLSLQETLFSRALLEQLIQEFGLYSKRVARYGVGAGVEQMQKKDLHFTVRESYTFRISYDADSPELAQAVVKRASDLLVQRHAGSQAEEAKLVQEFLNTEKARAEEEVRGRESELALLLAKHPELVDSTGGRLAALSMDSSGAEVGSLGLEMQALQLRERIEQTRRRPTVTGTRPAVAGNVDEARVRAEAEVVAAQRELAEKQSLFTEEYPDVKRAAMRVATAKAYLRRIDASKAPTAPAGATAPTAEDTPAAGGDPSEVKLLQQQLELVEKQVRVARSPRRPRIETPADPKALAKLRSEYIELERRARESREHLALLENRHFQVEMQAVFASQGKQGDLVIVDPAFKPVLPLRSTRNKILAVGILASLGLAVGLSLLRTLRDDLLRGPEDFSRFRLPPLLCEVPAPETESDA